MKSVLMALFLLSFGVSQAASVKISSKDALNLPPSANLELIPQEILGIFADQGLKLISIGNGTYQTRMKDINCQSRSNSALDGANSGIPTQICRFNSSPEAGSTTGTLIRDSRALLNLINKIESANSNLSFSDCILGGRCYTAVKSINCTVDTKIETFSDGRFVCEISDGL